jgi:hypothetical protein
MSNRSHAKDSSSMRTHSTEQPNEIRTIEDESARQTMYKPSNEFDLKIVPNDMLDLPPVGQRYSMFELFYSTLYE